MKLLSEIERQWAEDSPINKNDLFEESLRIPILHSKYLNYLNTVRSLLRKEESELETMFHLKKEHYGGYLDKDQIEDLGWDYSPLKGRTKPLKTEMDGFVKVDPDIKKIRNTIEELKATKDFLIDVIDSIKWRHQHIRNAIDWQKFQAGG